MPSKVRDELTRQVLEQIDAAELLRQQLLAIKDLYQQSNAIALREQIISSFRVAIERVCLGGSTLRKQMETVLADTHTNSSVKVEKLSGIGATLKESLQKDWLLGIEELVHSDLFSDFLDMAEHFLDQGFKDAAAVIAGGSLEGHLRKLCQKNGIPITVTINGKVQSKTAGTMNDDLRGANIYEKTPQKLLLGFIGIRNDAAHGDYAKVLPDNVKLMIMGIRSFINDYPA